MMKIILAALALALPLFGAEPATRLYGVYQEASLSSSAAVVTVQQPASGARFVTFEGAIIYCSVACVPTLEINGTAATTTAGTVIKLNTAADASKAVVFASSNVGTGTTVFKYNIAAGSPVPILPSGLALGLTAGQNITIRTDAITGTARILLMWSER